MLKLLFFFCSGLFNKFPRLFIVNIGLALLLVIVDTANVISIAPIVALVTNENAPQGIAKSIFDVCQSFGIQPDNLVGFISLFVSLSVASSLISVGITYFLLKSQFIVRRAYTLGLCEDLLYSSMNFINRKRQGDFINVMIKEVAQVADAFTSLSRSIAPFIQAGVLLAIPFYISVQTSALAIFFAIILISPLRIAQKHLYNWGKKNVEVSNEFSSTLQEILSNIGIISGFANETQEVERLDKSFSKVRKTSINLQIIQSAVFYAYNPIGIILVFFTYIIGQKLNIGISETVVMLLAFHRLSAVLRAISTNMNQLLTLVPSYEKINNIRSEAKTNRPNFGTIKFDNLKKPIIFNNVTFSYTGKKNVLENINLIIPKNEITALVGASGAGKSTIADILLGLHEISDGKIIINDLTFDKFDITSYKKCLGYVPQQSSLFNESVRKNILWAQPTASNDDIIEACRQANANEFINELENGLETIVGDRGVQLSGGQVQRIALARALVRKPDLLLLDEATSALDTESERLIQDSIEKIARKTTLLIIAHRLSTIKKANSIYVLDSGKIIESGNFSQLINNGGHFSKLVKMQKL